VRVTVSSEGLHVPREKLKGKTLNLHYAITSLIEEFEAVDWYRQRADDCDDPTLEAILRHNAREELEHAAMVLEWIRRNDGEANAQLKEYLFTEGSITGREEDASGKA
jgi:uncharacterized protein